VKIGDVDFFFNLLQQHGCRVEVIPAGIKISLTREGRTATRTELWIHLEAARHGVPELVEILFDSLKARLDHS